jgi:hypothetical protein
MSSTASASTTLAPSRWDRIGVIVSGICLVHCLFLPILVATLPLWPMADSLHDWLHPVFALLLIPITLMAVRSGLLKHDQKSPAFLLGSGLLVILGAALWGHYTPGFAAESVLTLAGSGLLIGGHWRNWQADRCCEEATSCTTHEGHDHA